MRAARDPLLRAWAGLAALSLASTLAALAVEALEGGPLDGRAARAALAAAILAFAGLKARLILERYLGLADAPFWRRGFAVAAWAFLALLLALFLAA